MRRNGNVMVLGFGLFLAAVALSEQIAFNLLECSGGQRHGANRAQSAALAFAGVLHVDRNQGPIQRGGQGGQMVVIHLGPQLVEGHFGEVPLKDEPLDG